MKQKYENLQTRRACVFYIFTQTLLEAMTEKSLRILFLYTVIIDTYVTVTTCTYGK